MRLLAPLLLLAAAAVCGWTWWQRSAALERRVRAAAAGAGATAPAPRPPDAIWLRAGLGALPPAPSAAALRAALAELGLAEEPAGWPLLEEGEAGAAARVELGRWLDQPPEAGARARALRLERSADGRAIDLRFELAGPPPAALAWLARLLEPQGGRGYLSDPLRVQLAAAGEAELGATVIVRVHPAARFLEDAERGAAG